MSGQLQKLCTFFLIPTFHDAIISSLCHLRIIHHFVEYFIVLVRFGVSCRNGVLWWDCNAVSKERILGQQGCL